MSRTARPTKLPQLEPLNRGSRVVYDADYFRDSEDKSPEYLEPLGGGYGTFKLNSHSKSSTELPKKFFPRSSPQNALFRLNLDTARTDGKSRSSLEAGLAERPRTTRRQALNTSMSCPHLNKAVETVRSVRLPNIAVPCTQLVRSLVKNTRPPGSALAKGKEPHFEIVTPAAFNLTFEGIAENDEESEHGDEGDVGDGGDDSSDGGSVLLIERGPSPSLESRSRSGSPNPSPTSPGPVEDHDDDASSLFITQTPLPNPHPRVVSTSSKTLTQNESTTTTLTQVVEVPVVRNPPPRSASLPTQRMTKATPVPLQISTTPVTPTYPASAPPTSVSRSVKPPLSPPTAQKTQRKPRPLPTPPAYQQPRARSQTAPLPVRPNVDRDLPPIPAS
ncbi:hypothetical protein V5O48_003661 [Marasmius crinis-equi]|uniref:Uncharacterized protein n=1 Tax=Marasmius crinis-equi TaxID=585013 RepID=A0ABR3FSB1_9AGAR